jgi:hypothetical protein
MKMKMKQGTYLSKYSNTFSLLVLFLFFIILLCVVLQCRNWFLKKEVNENFVNLHSLLGLDNPQVMEVPESNVKNIKEFPPSVDIISNISSSDEFKGSDNQELLNQLSGKPITPLEKIEKTLPPSVQKPEVKNQIVNKQIEDFVRKKNKQAQTQTQKPTKMNVKKEIKSASETFNIQNMNTCSFIQGECPTGKRTIGGFGFHNLPEGVQFVCGNNPSIKSAKLVAEISQGKISNISVIDGGKGYHPMKKYKIKVEGSSGNINQIDADVIIGDDGSVKVIQIINGGSGFQDTPKVSILNDSMGNGETCNLCC